MRLRFVRSDALDNRLMGISDFQKLIKREQRLKERHRPLVTLSKMPEMSQVLSQDERLRKDEEVLRIMILMVRSMARHSIS